MGLGTAVWYIGSSRSFLSEFGTLMKFLYTGSGTGPGNAYGLAASMGVFLVPLLFLRVFAPTHNSMPYLMCNVGYPSLLQKMAIFTDPIRHLGHYSTGCRLLVA